MLSPYCPATTLKQAPGDFANTITERSHLKKLYLAGPAAARAMQTFNQGAAVMPRLSHPDDAAAEQF
jgi:hypothetical protein